MTEQQIEQVRQLSQWLAGTDITLFELSGPGRTIRLSRNGGRCPPDTGTDIAIPAHANQELPPVTVVRAGSVGVFLQSHPLREEPLVRAGEEVVEGQTIALLKIGLVLLPVAAPRAGIIARTTATHESAVGYGDALIEIQ